MARDPVNVVVSKPLTNLLIKSIKITEILINSLTKRWLKECVKLTIYNINEEDDDDLTGQVTDGSLVRFFRICSMKFRTNLQKLYLFLIFF